jgi:cytochrome P450
MEVMRISVVSPLAVPHLAMKDTQLQGFTIPKVVCSKLKLLFHFVNLKFNMQGSVVSVNLDSMLQDPKIWRDPENFRPERHLDQKGKLIKNEAFAPFGIGKFFFRRARIIQN